MLFSVDISLATVSQGESVCSTSAGCQPRGCAGESAGLAARGGRRVYRAAAAAEEQRACSPRAPSEPPGG
ncbi:Hypothetical predicted protein [Marmota monax]|uniref:Uncharacterized protein n=1 Tax=Marmota monax TaxID=9995 RepID=A0A5E4AQU2_MARMO|nr:Hypothetical predicted protein [Marmota monax]